MSGGRAQIDQERMFANQPIGHFLDHGSNKVGT
jgi:hypothetical protein